MTNKIKIKNKMYLHREFRIGWIRFSYYKFGKKLTIRFELSKGW